MRLAAMVAMALAAAAASKLYAEEPAGLVLSETEQALFDETLAKYEVVNPIDPKTGRRKFIAFGVLSDLHACKRIEGDDDLEDPRKDYWYYWGSVLTESGPSIRLLGALARKVPGVRHHVPGV